MHIPSVMVHTENWPVILLDCWR